MHHNKQTDQASLFARAKALPQFSVRVAAFRGESHLLSFLYFVLACSIAGYIYFVGLSIMNVIANREASIESERLQSEVAALEQAYFELAKEVTPAAASEHGLTAPLATSFVKRDVNYATNVTVEDL